MSEQEDPQSPRDDRGPRDASRPRTPSARRRLPISIPWFVALCVWTAFIWGNSLVVGQVSDAGSTSVAGFLEPIFWFFSVRDPHQMNYVVRKAAHFSEYAVLGFLDGLAFRNELLPSTGDDGGLRGWRIVALIPLLAVPVIDECIQLVVPGRDGNVTDVLIDLAGACLGFIVALGLIHVLTPPPRRA